MFYSNIFLQVEAVVNSWCSVLCGTCNGYLLMLVATRVDL